MEKAALARRVTQRASELGLGAVGIAAVRPSDHEAFLKRWLEDGYAGAMSWMHRTSAVSVDLRRRFTWARSAIVAAVSYLPYGGERHAQAGLSPHVARYALGRDYHTVLGSRLAALVAFLEAESPGVRCRVYVDTGPVLERELARRAGLGWFGKSTNLIRPRGDSWVVLGEILTSLDLPPDEPVADYCGTCTACIDDCPTGAILEPYLVDSTRCISYLTIELRDAIPGDRRGDLGDWVFGCDVCQEVCPWNRKVTPTSDPEFAPGPHLTSADLEGLVRIDDETLRSRFAGTPLTRPRRRGLVRNAMIVAANTQHGPALRAAGERLADADPVVRSTAAWAVGRTGGRAGRRALEARRASEPEPGVRAEIDAALDGGGS
jgi:epoxyqueuosine reductase